MASATRGLVVKISIPNIDVNGLESLKVTATVTNTSDETLKLLNDPHGVLYSFPVDKFTITSPAGTHLPFIGAMVNHPSVGSQMRALTLLTHFQLKYDPDVEARLGDPSDFTVLTPGASTDVIHDREMDRVDFSWLAASWNNPLSCRCVRFLSVRPWRVLH